VTVLRTVVQTAMLAVLDTRHDLSLSRIIAGQLVRDHYTRGDALLFEYLTPQALGCFGVAAALNQDVEYGPVLVDGPPQPMLLAAVADDDLVEVPFIAGCRKTAADLVRKALAD
jgi:hypothetical protein